MSTGRTALIAACLVLAIGAAAYFALRPPEVRRIAFLGMDSQMQATRIAAFRDEMAKRGFVEGRNLHIDYAWAEGRFERLPELAKELAARKPEAIVTAAPPSIRAAQAATATIPIVMSVHDPIGMGFAKSMGHPDGNITGVGFQDSELTTKRLDYLRRVVPGLTRAAILWNEAGGGPRTPHDVARAAEAMGIATRLFEVHTPAEIEPAVAAAHAWGAQALIQIASPFFTKHRGLLLGALAVQRMPASCEMRLYVDEGCLMSYGADLDKLFRGMARMTVQILDGRKVADIPIEQPREFDLVINVRAARDLGLEIPKLVLLEATDVVK